jgi:uncharacterized damage-inducible protein DinB
MDPETIQCLYDFHYWARDRLLPAIEPLPESQYTQQMPGGWGSLADTLAHMVAAEEIWLARLQGSSPTRLAGLTDMPTFAAMRQRWAASEAAYQSYLNRADAAELARLCEYKDTKGNHFSNPVWQLLLHVLNHATEHRAQISTMLASIGVSHPGLDMILFWRERSNL